MRRSDDNAEVLQKRLQTYHTQTTPVIEYYKRRGIWSKVNAELPADVVWYQLLGIFSRTGHLPQAEIPTSFSVKAPKKAEA